MLTNLCFCWKKTKIPTKKPQLVNNKSKKSEKMRQNLIKQNEINEKIDEKIDEKAKKNLESLIMTLKYPTMYQPDLKNDSPKLTKIDDKTYL